MYLLKSTQVQDLHLSQLGKYKLKIPTKSLQCKIYILYLGGQDFMGDV